VKRQAEYYKYIAKKSAVGLCNSVAWYCGFFASRGAWLRPGVRGSADGPTRAASGRRPEPAIFL